MFSVQACPKREVLVRVALRERLTLAYVREHSKPGKMGEDDAGMGNEELWRQVRSHAYDLSRRTLLRCLHSLMVGENRRCETALSPAYVLDTQILEQAHS